MPPIPKTIIKTSTAGAFNLWKFIWKYKFLLLIIFSLIPTLIVSINVAKETNNPYYPFVQAGVSIVNSDSILYEDIKILETNPAQLIGMEKPEIGIWQHIKYSFKVFLVVWALLGLLSLISIPFFLFYFIYDKFNASTKVRTFFLALFTFLIFILFINMLIVIIKQAGGDVLYTFDQSLDFYGRAKQVISWVMPLHGFWALMKYIVALL